MRGTMGGWWCGIIYNNVMQRWRRHDFKGAVRAEDFRDAHDAWLGRRCGSWRVVRLLLFAKLYDVVCLLRRW